MEILIIMLYQLSVLAGYKTYGTIKLFGEGE